MAKTLVAAMWVVIVSASRYVDYANVKVSQYGNSEYDSPQDSLAADDYQDNSVDALAALDYKYEEDIRDDKGKSEKLHKIPDENRSTQKFTRKYIMTYSPERNEDQYLYDYNLYIDKVPTIRPNNRNSRQRSKIKHNSFKRHRDVSQNRLFKNICDKDDSGSRKEYFPTEKDIDKNINQEKNQYDRNHNTQKVIGRKPRDKFVKNLLDMNTELEELVADRKLIGGSQNYDYKENDDERDLFVNPNRASQENYSAIIDEDEERVSSVPYKYKFKHKGKIYDDYNDYYDMKRIYRIRNKLPALRRTLTVRKISTSTLPIRLDNYLRRLLNLSDTRRHSAIDFTRITETTTNSFTNLQSTSTIISAKDNAASSKAPDRWPLSETSRLSELKELQSEEVVQEISTNSTPVQVTKEKVSIVLVQPRTNQQPWLRVRQLSEDSPDTAKQIKLLMRKKVSAQGQNVDAISDNWDQMVCDYVDLSLAKTSDAVGNVVNNLVVFFILLLYIVQSLL